MKGFKRVTSYPKSQSRPAYGPMSSDDSNSFTQDRDKDPRQAQKKVGNSSADKGIAWFPTSTSTLGGYRFFTNKSSD